MVVDEIHLEGITVFGCAQGSSKVLALVQTVLPDVVILDLNVPGTAGLRTLARLKQAEPEIPVIVLSHYELPPLRQACLEGGAAYFFGKTASFDRVCETLKRMTQTEKRRGRPAAGRAGRTGTIAARRPAKSI